jgi:P27 family predicted phage terminase small subunit
VNVADARRVDLARHKSPFPARRKPVWEGGFRPHKPDLSKTAWVSHFWALRGPVSPLPIPASLPFAVSEAPFSPFSTLVRKTGGFPVTTDPALSVNALPGHPTKVPEPPSDLQAPGLRAWTAIWSEPQTALADRLIIEQLARLEDECAELRAQIAEQGTTLSKKQVTPKGVVVGVEEYAHPAIRELRRCGAEALQIARELGLSPQSRLKMGLAIVEIAQKQATPDAIDEIRNRRAKRRGEPLPPGGVWPREPEVINGSSNG